LGNFDPYGRARPGETAVRTAVPWWFADTEEVTGSNPVAPTTVLAGQGPWQYLRTALFTCRDRAAAADYSPPSRMGPLSRTVRDHHQPNDHAAWSPSPGPAPRSPITPATCPGRACGGRGSNCSFPTPNQSTGTCGGPAPLSAMRRARRRSLRACQAAAQVCRRHWCQPPGQRSTIPSPPGPIRVRRPSRSPTTAACRTRCANRGLSHRTGVRNPARCGQRGCGTRRLSVRTPGSHRSCGHRSPGHWTSARAVGRTHGGQWMRTGRRTAWPASGHPGRPRRPRPPAWRRKPRLGCNVCGA
jgi:hypothetical protein